MMIYTPRAFGTAIGTVDGDGDYCAVSCSRPRSSPSLSEWSHREIRTPYVAKKSCISYNRKTKWPDSWRHCN